MSELEEVTLPIAEEFDSIQGEGQWVGTPMRFIRLAGCPVGRPASAVKLAKGPLPVLPTGATAMACASWDGRGFWCDTDYNTHYLKTPVELMKSVWQKHICLTGGEPLIHWNKLKRLFDLGEGVRFHFETSGTVNPSPGWKVPEDIWVTCAPKIGALDYMIEHADELKILVDATFHPDELTPSMRAHHNVFLCPINDINTVRQDNVDRCLMWLKQFPNWRLSCQVHKFLGLR